ncbi:MAG: hypothetical protein L0287_36815 [Anaerolineae bacterium]|nr:hypothetical protein [Anaerolineae bacterium]
MHIQAELDEIHSKRLTLLQHHWKKPIPEVLETMIDLAIAQTPGLDNPLPESMTIGQWSEINLSREGLYDDNGR